MSPQSDKHVTKPLCAHCGAPCERPSDVSYHDAGRQAAADALGICLACMRLRAMRNDVLGGRRSDYPGMTQAMGVRAQAALVATGRRPRLPLNVLACAYALRYLPPADYAAHVAAREAEEARATRRRRPA